MDNKLILLTSALIAVALVVFYFLYRANKKEKAKPRRTREQEIEFDAELRYEYHLALHSGDTEKAFTIGRNYYQSLLGGRLTHDIDQAISNDLSTIKKV